MRKGCILNCYIVKKKPKTSKSFTKVMLECVISSRVDTCCEWYNLSLNKGLKVLFKKLVMKNNFITQIILRSKSILYRPYAKMVAI